MSFGVEGMKNLYPSKCNENMPNWDLFRLYYSRLDFFFAHLIRFSNEIRVLHFKKTAGLEFAFFF